MALNVLNVFASSKGWAHWELMLNVNANRPGGLRDKWGKKSSSTTVKRN